MMRRIFARVRARWQAPVLRALADLDARRRQDYRQLEALTSLMAVLRPRAPFPAFREWAVSPDFACWIFATLLAQRPSRVLECGSGVSTLVAGYAVAHWQGQVLSVEHDPIYAYRTRDQVALHGLEEAVTVIDAPLLTTRDGWLWYDTDAIPPGPIDCLVVDGPPASAGSRVRAPAVPLLANRLAPGATILVDDTARPDEAEMLTQWQSAYPGLTIEVLPGTEKGAARLTWPSSRDAAGGAGPRTATSNPARRL
jgi:predicted O-methyltransferase YrrM